MLFVAAQSFRRGRPAATAASAPGGIERTPIRKVNSVLTLGSIALSVAALISFASSIFGRLGVVEAPSVSNNSSSSLQLRGSEDDDKRENDIQIFDFAPDGDITEQPPHLTPIDPAISLQSRGFTTLDKAHREGLVHAGNFVYVVDKDDKLLLMRRGPDLVTCPLAWSMVGEHAYRDESKKETLMRGIEEELGGKTLKSLVDEGSYTELSDLPLFYFRDYGPELDGRIDRQVTYIWLVELGLSAEELENGILQLDEEVYEHKWIPLNEAEKWVKDDMAAVKDGGKLDTFCHDTMGSLMQVCFDRIRARRGEK